jgi:hypothetical protein
MAPVIYEMGNLSCHVFKGGMTPNAFFTPKYLAEHFWKERVTETFPCCVCVCVCTHVHVQCLNTNSDLIEK